MEVIMPEEVLQDESLELIDDELDVSLIENDAPGDGESQEVIRVGEEEVPYDDVIKAYQNKSEWQKSNTQRAQEIAEDKRRLEEQQRQIEQREVDLRAWEQGMYQGRTQAQPQEQPQNADFNLTPEELEDMTAYERKMYNFQKTQAERFNQWQKDQEQREFANQMQSRHEKLKSQYNDYDPTQIERSLIQGREPFEDAYLAEKYKAITQGNRDALMGLIPEDIKTQLKTEAKQELIADWKKKQQQRKNVSTTKPSAQGLAKVPGETPKNYYEANDSALKALHDEGLSLIE